MEADQWVPPETAVPPNLGKAERLLLFASKIYRFWKFYETSAYLYPSTSFPADHRVRMKRFRTTDLLYIAAFAAIGLAAKPVVTPLVHIVSAPLMIPGGSLAGGFYMLWLGLAVAAVPKPGAALLTAAVQAAVMLSGLFGSHGALSLLTYTLPGAIVELTALFFRHRDTLFAQIAFCTAANLMGTLIVVLLVMRLTAIPAAISLTTATISGILGGVLARGFIVRLQTLHLIESQVKK
jgi:energy-coupling factor transport system substrate-specific component